MERAKTAAGQAVGWDSPHPATPGHLTLASGMVLKGIESAHRKDGEEFLVSGFYCTEGEINNLKAEIIRDETK